MATITKQPKKPAPKLVIEKRRVNVDRRLATQLRAWLKRYDVWCRSKRKSKGRHARTKGHSFEREVAALLRGVFPECRRHLEYQDAEANGVDLVHTGHYRIQCKRNIKYASVAAINEITCEHALGEVPVLVTQADKCEVLAVLPFSELVRLLEQVPDLVM